MQITNTTLHFIGKCLLFFGVAVLSMSFFSSMTYDAQAHTNPGGCNATGVNLSFEVFESDGVTPLGAGTVTEGDTLKYQATLSHAGGGNCNYEGGTLTITTPDGDVTDVAGGVIPLISAGSPFVSSQVTYVATAADVGGDGDLDAFATYSNGTSHLGGNVTPVGATAPASTPFVIPLVIEKTVNASFDREWNWTIDKSADQTSLTLGSGDTQTVNYEVVLSATSEDANRMASGTITITNPDGNPDATVTGVSDELNNSGALTVDCTGDGNFSGFPHTLAGGETLTCTYSGASDGTDTENTATVETEGDVPGGSDTVEVAWSTDPTSEIDECVTVNDTNTQFPAGTQVCAGDEDKTIEYSVDFGPEGSDVVVACGEGTHPNTADFVTNDTQATGNDDETVTWTVNCDLSCTYTQGYWKTHNDLFKGGAPADETWELLPNGEETIFFLSGQNWVTVFNTPPKGNAYYILAHQYMAAELNLLSGASAPSEVQAALDDAEAFFSANAPTAAISKTLKAELTALAGTLGSFNEGAIGPGHCGSE